MKSAVWVLSTSLLTGIFLVGCSSSDSPGSGGTGGRPVNGSGGAVGTGGSPTSSGGTTGTGGTPTSSGGAPGTGGAGTGGAPSSSGGAPGTGGGASGGAPGTGGAPSATGGTTGSGGGGVGSGGAVGTGGTMGGGGAAGGGSGTVTFAAVATILGNSCGTGQCHQGTAHTDLRNNAGLHARIVGGMPMGMMVEATCVGRTLVVAGNPGTSIISQIIKVGGLNGCGPRMPNGCSATGNNPRPCLTMAQIATIDAWIAAGAPM